ncbi:MAG: molybdopterin-binding/glycosyltransferase family 2 protein [Alphaproteobacteria bacterium]|nr:molybdopterin-binding/glycosyltransferase family 2 protein [Alphaproteobacteria bacterium]
MKFGETPLDDAAGAILAHSVRRDGLAFKKGRVLTPDDITALRDTGIDTVVAARLDADDVGEDDAATRIAKAAQGAGLRATSAFTGRVNLVADAQGIAVIDPQVEALNLIHEAITVATLPRWELVDAKQIVATIKVIPFAAPAKVVADCEALAGRIAGGMIRVAALQPKRIGLIQTRLAGTKESVLDKTRNVLEARLQTLGGTLVGELRCPHESAGLAAAITKIQTDSVDIVLIAGASAITDRRDVIPAAIMVSGGIIDHFGMPVDPGNLLMVARIADTPVVGLPGCARSPKLNGVDWILQRLCADLPVASADIMAMGVGGLLKEIPGRPQPRSAGEPRPAAPHAPRVAALILAAGQSRRMGPLNKLLQPVDGKPMVQWAVEAARESHVEAVYVVVGHEAQAVRAALDGDAVSFIDNPDYADGISTSIRRAVATLPDELDGAVVCLGDMPRIGPQQIDRLIAAFNPVEGRSICIPTWRGKRGNPVLIGRQFFAEIQEISGDVGARYLIGQYPDLVCEVEMDDDAVLVDVDTPQALDALSA